MAWHGTDISAAAQWRVTVTVNGVTALTATSEVTGYNKWKTVRPDGSFAVSEGDSVSVAITQTGTNKVGYLDNIELVPANIVSNPGFESGALGAWECFGGSSVTAYTSYSSQWGGDMFEGVEGRYFMQIQRSTAIGQTLQVPEPGRYRIRLHARTRAGSGASYGLGRLAVSMVHGTTTNCIARMAVDTEAFRPYTFWWNAPVAGEYKLVIQGLANGDGDKWRNSMVDDISVVKFDGVLASETPDISDKLELSVASGAEVALDFPGTLRLFGLRLDGVSSIGTFSAATHPEYFTGTGMIEVLPKGTIILFN